MKTRRHFAALLCLAGLASAVSAASSSAPAGASVALPAPAEPAAAKKTDSAKASVGAKSPAVVARDLRFQQMRDHIDALFGGRIATPPPPDLRYNPFRPIGASPPVPARDASAGREAPPPVSPSSDLAVVQQAVATLKVRGVVEKDGRSLLMINSGPNKDGTYKEGDVLTVIVQDEPVHLRVRQITHYSVMFSLNDAEYTLKF